MSLWSVLNVTIVLVIGWLVYWLLQVQVNDIYTLPPPRRRRGTLLCTYRSVGWYVGLSQACATSNWRTLNPMNFKLGTLININIKMIPIPRQVSMSRSRSFLVPTALPRALWFCSPLACQCANASVFRTFLCRLLRYWLGILLMTVSRHIKDQVWVLSCLTDFNRSYCPLLNLFLMYFPVLSF